MTLSTPCSVKASLSRVDTLVADQRLGQLGVALGNVDQVVDNATLRAHHQVEIAKPDIKVDDTDPLAALGQRRADRSRRGRLSHSAFS
jgi:hypothetical protein